MPTPRWQSCSCDSFYSRVSIYKLSEPLSVHIVREWSFMRIGFFLPHWFDLHCTSTVKRPPSWIPQISLYPPILSPTNYQLPPTPLYNTPQTFQSMLKCQLSEETCPDSLSGLLATRLCLHLLSLDSQSDFTQCLWIFKLVPQAGLLNSTLVIFKITIMI